jgi:hypothetical protein
MSLLITDGHRVITFRVLTAELEDEAVAVAFSMAWHEAGAAGRGGAEQALDRLAAFRGEVYRCLGGRPDALFELADAVLCRQCTAGQARTECGPLRGPFFSPQSAV